MNLESLLPHDTVKTLLTHHQLEARLDWPFCCHKTEIKLTGIEDGLSVVHGTVGIVVWYRG